MSLHESEISQYIYSSFLSPFLSPFSSPFLSILEPRIQQGAVNTMGHEFGAFKFVGHWWWSVFSVAPGTMDGNQRRNQFERVWYLQLQPGLQFRSIRWFRLFMVVQLLFLQQETQTYRIFYVQSNQVIIRISTGFFYAMKFVIHILTKRIIWMFQLCPNECFRFIRYRPWFCHGRRWHGLKIQAFSFLSIIFFSL